MRRFAHTRRQAIVSALAALSSLAVGRQVSAKPKADDSQALLPAVGKPLDLPALELLGGGKFTPKQAEGKILVLYWWASTCPFCALQSPHMEALWKAHKARDLQMVALSIDKTREAAQDYIKKKGYTFPVAMFSPELARKIAKPKGLPVVVVRGKDGLVKLVESGEMFPEDIEKIGQWV